MLVLLFTSTFMTDSKVYIAFKPLLLLLTQFPHSFMNMCNYYQLIFIYFDHLVGFEDHPTLSTPDQVTLCIIEKYLDFKQGEVWKEITSELEQEGVRPVTPDQVRCLVISFIGRSPGSRGHQLQTYVSVL